MTDPRKILSAAQPLTLAGVPSGFLPVLLADLARAAPSRVVLIAPDEAEMRAVAATAGFFAPLLLLLFRAVKQSRPRLRSLALILCVLGWLESVWITLPSINGMTWHTAWMAPLAMLAMTALLLAMILSPYQEIEA